MSDDGKMRWTEDYRFPRDDMGDDGWWNREPEDLRQGCAVILAGVLLGWGAIALAAWAAIRWWGAS